MTDPQMSVSTGSQTSLKVAYRLNLQTQEHESQQTDSHADISIACQIFLKEEEPSGHYYKNGTYACNWKCDVSRNLLSKSKGEKKIPKKAAATQKQTNNNLSHSNFCFFDYKDHCSYQKTG